MNFETTPLEGLIIIHPKVFTDARGFFFESFNQEKFSEAGIDLTWLQDNHAQSVMNSIRALHFQRGEGQAKIVRCTRGVIWDVAVDIRPDSPTLGKWHAVELSAENKKMFYIPSGFAHGYAVLSDVAESLYKCNRLYDPELEDGIAWDDPDLAIDWPVEHPLLSERDRRNRSFREYLESL